MELPRRRKLLFEFVGSANFQINRTSAISGGFDPAPDDYIHKLWQWRQRCPDSDKIGHGSFCKRCDTPWRYSSDGGVLWLGRDDWRTDPERAGSDSVAKGPRLLDRLADSGSVLTPSGKRGEVPKFDERGTAAAETTILPDFWPTRTPLQHSHQAMEPFWTPGQKVRTMEALSEACLCTQFWGLTANRNGYGLDLPEDDFVTQYAKFRESCPKANHPGHAAYCDRCDNSFPSSVGGADWLRKQGWREINPLEKFPEPLQPRKGPQVSPTVWENVDSPNPRVPLAPRNPGAKIKELTEVTALEKDTMADNEATRDLFREILGMTDGGTTGGRGPMHIPADIMDSLAGDAAQDSLARERLIMEMRKAESRAHDPRFVSLDLMEMEATDVDSFLKSARQKIIKRSKPTRKACCAKIGGVLDQIMGPAGGSESGNLELQGVRDRGKMDPIGDVDSMAEGVSESGVTAFRQPRSARETYGHYMDIPGALPHGAVQQAEREGRKAADKQDKIKDVARAGRERSKMVASDVDHDILSFIAEEFFHYEHDFECDFSDPKFSIGESRGFASKRPGLLREYFGLNEDAGLDMGKAKKVLAMLEKKKAEGSLAGQEAALLPRLRKIVKMSGGGDDAADKQEEDYVMEPSKTALALSSFMESSHNAYAAAHSGSGKGSPGSLLRKQDYAGDMSRAERDDNKDYPTELMPAKSGGNKTAGAPGKLSTRDKDAGDPIGEAVAAPAPERGDSGDEGPSGVIPGPRKAGVPGKPKLPAARAGANRVKRFMKQPARPGGRLGGSGGPSASSLERMFKQSGQKPDMQDVDYDGPVISETAMALANFMESSQQAEAKKKLALGKGDAGDLSLGKRTDTRENLGGPLQKFSGMRGGLDVYDDGGKKARFDKDANPIGGAVPGEQSAKRMKK